MNLHQSIPDTLACVPRLREEALDLSRTKQNQPVTLRERVVIKIIIERSCDRFRSTVCESVHSDLLDYEIPKFTALVGWLASYGLVSTHPNAITEVARYLLGHTRVEVDSTIDWDAVRQTYPQL